MCAYGLPSSSEGWNSLQQAKATLQQGQEAYRQYAASPEKTALMMKKQLTDSGPNLALRSQEAEYNRQLSTAPYEYADTSYMPEITNPLIRGRLAAQREAGIEKNLAITQATRQQYEGNVLDIIGAATANIKANNERLTMELEFKKEGYAAAFQELGMMTQAEAEERAEQWKQKEFDEQKRQFDEQMSLSYQQLAAASSGGGGGGSSTEKPLAEWEAQALEKSGATASIMNFYNEGRHNEQGATESKLFPTIMQQYPTITADTAWQMIYDLRKPFEGQSSGGISNYVNSALRG